MPCEIILKHISQAQNRRFFKKNKQTKTKTYFNTSNSTLFHTKCFLQYLGFSITLINQIESIAFNIPTLKNIHYYERSIKVQIMSFNSHHGRFNWFLAITSAAPVLRTDIPDKVATGVLYEGGPLDLL